MSAISLKRAGRAGFQTIAAADTFRIVRCFPDANVHAAGFLTFAAFCTAAFLHPVPIKCDRVEKTVHCAQRTEVFAEWAVYQYR